ncbi:protein FAM83C-like [Sinocyclocheilus rhinocerous]|uniref:Protein FAM83C-like n=1 Tax=Sinocyclocheilus rhinocerous TaxID=307959 RepID=A0A673L644_9TELE|nr:PREDICTED: protein FAM83C-like [Sinocyclocheilus rhinocerous]
MISSEVLRPTPNPARKMLGKLANRLEEVKNPWRQGSTLELSHNETARLATDALLEHGEKEYKKVLQDEREVNFLSPLEIRYITENVAKVGGADSGTNGVDMEEGDTVSELTSGTYFPMMSDEEPPMLELGWPEVSNRFGPTEAQIHFQRDKSKNLKDLIRSLISKAKKVIAIVMDIFTDVDLFCDLMEASNKRRVPVYILLDEKNLSYFLNMCSEQDIQNSHLSNMRVRSVCGDTYCTKSGKKFTGQVQEKFMIIDCEEVIAGSYSFTWLSGMVHSNMLMHFSGRVTDCFDREFRCMYADSQIIDRFHNPDEDGLPGYSYHMPVPNLGLDILADYGSRERVYSEHSSSQSSSSVSSIKAAPPGMKSIKVTPDKKNPENSQKPPDRKGVTSPVLQKPSGPHIVRGSPNGTLQSQAVERTSLGQTSGVEWSKIGTTDYLRSNIPGQTSKIQALGLYSSPKPPSPTQQTPTDKVTSKYRLPTPFISKFTDLFSSKEKDSHFFQKMPTHSSPFGGPDLSQSEPESKQGPAPPGPMLSDRMGPEKGIHRRDEKRMTLGHSKLDLVNQYNKLNQSKQVYSRFELKNNIPQ